MAITTAAAILGAAAIGAGTTVIASSKAAKAQGKAAEEAKNIAESTFEEQKELNEPFRQGGLTAQNRVLELLGLGPRPEPVRQPNVNTFAPTNQPNVNAFAPTARTPEDYGLTEIKIPNIMGRQYGDTSYLMDAEGNYDPDFLIDGQRTGVYRDAQGNFITDVNAYMAENPLPADVNMMAAPAAAAPAAAPPESDYGKYARDFSMKDFEADPGYAFRQSEGMKALERSAAARGGLLSGGTLKGIQRFGQDLASTEYTNAFNRYQVNRSNQLNPLFSLMGAGQNATNMVTNAAGNAGANEAAAVTNAGAARASGYVATGNAINQGLGSLTNYYVNQPLNNAMIGYYNRGAASTTPATGGSFGGGGGIINRGYINPYASGY